MFKKLLVKVQGRSTAFLIAFFISGNILHLLHRLDTTYISYMAVLMGLVVGHSIKEDYHERAMSAGDTSRPSLTPKIPNEN